MRRENLDLSYKDRTADIVESSYSQWQLAYNNNREFSHILTNRLVSITDGLYPEIEYVENMFFPDMMDINEEWLVYEVNGTFRQTDLLLSGDALGVTLTQASSLDEFIAGPYDHFDIMSSGEMGFSISHGCSIDGGIAFISDDKVNVYNSTTGIVTSTQIYAVSSGETTIYVDRGYMDFAFQIEMENITVKDINGNIVSHKYIDQSMCTGGYNDNLDIDSNGIINKVEEAYLRKHKGKSSADYTPEEWNDLKWMDNDADGVIGTSDYNYLMSMIPTMRGDIVSGISLPVNSVGTYTIAYEQKIPRSELIIPAGQGYHVFYNNEDIPALYSKITYDESVKILYGINRKDNRVYAVRLDDTYSVLSTARLFVNTGREKHTIVDISMHQGYLFILTSFNGKYYIMYEDTRKEFIEYVGRKAYVDIPGAPVIKGMVIDKTGHFHFYNDTVLYEVKAHRNKFIEMNDTVYFNIDHPVTNLSGDPVVMLPWNIFNSFDSFAFSFGIERPTGCDNVQMKRLIYDFWKYRQDNTPIGMNYGIKRELGLTNVPNSYVNIKYQLPAQIAASGDISINGYNMARSGNINSTTLSGIPGTFQLISGDTIIPPDEYYADNSEFKITADFIDGNTDTQNISYNVMLTDHYTTPDIEVYSLGDPVYARSERCIYTSGELMDKILLLEQTDPFIYKNMKTNICPLNAARISSIPMMATIYGPEISAGDSDSILI